MKRYIIPILLLMPCLMCFQCGECDDYETTTTRLRMENATTETLYFGLSDQPWPNADCYWRRLPAELFTSYSSNPPSPGALVSSGGRGKYLLLVDARMRMRLCWSCDSSLLTVDSLWVCDTVVADSPGCDDMLATRYSGTFTLCPEHLCRYPIDNKYNEE